MPIPTSQPANPTAPDPAPLPDSHLRCPHCQYNLTGLLQNRCPECGRDFDPETLLRRATGNIPTPATPWDSAPPYNFKAFCQTWLLAAFHPRRLARDFPACHDDKCALSYSRTCNLINGFLLLGAIIATSFTRERDVMGILVMSAAIWLAACLACGACESLVAQFISGSMESEKSPPNYPTTRWPGLMRYTAGFSNLSAGWTSLLILAGGLFPLMPGPYRAALLLGGPFLIALWWLIAICAMVYEQHRRWSTVITTFFVTPLIATVSVILGGFLTMLIAIIPVLLLFK